jgi:hypothetical protein
MCCSTAGSFFGMGSEFASGLKSRAQLRTAPVRSVFNMMFSFDGVFS